MWPASFRRSCIADCLCARALVVPAVLGLSLACSGTDTAGPRVCTLIGCEDGLKVELDPGSGWPAGAYRFTLRIDDTPVVCSASLPLPACAIRAVVCVPAGPVTIAESGCALPAASHGFSQIVLERNLRPKRVDVTVTRDDTTVAQAQLVPVFQKVQPNGPDCPPACDVAQGRIAVNFR